MKVNPIVSDLLDKSHILGRFPSHPHWPHIYFQQPYGTVVETSGDDWGSSMATIPSSGDCWWKIRPSHGWNMLKLPAHSFFAIEKTPSGPPSSWYINRPVPATTWSQPRPRSSGGGAWRKPLEETFLQGNHAITKPKNWEIDPTSMVTLQLGLCINIYNII